MLAAVGTNSESERAKEGEEAEAGEGTLFIVGRKERRKGSRVLWIECFRLA